MAGERTPDTSSHTIVGSSDDDISLREHMQRQIDQQGRHFERVISDLKELLDERENFRTKAIDELANATQKRFEGVNEFRDQLRDQAATFISKTEANVRMDSLAEKFDGNSSRINAMELRISSRLDLHEGQGAGLDKAWGYIIGAVGLASAVIAIIIATR